MKYARVSFYIVCKSNLSVTETPESVLGAIVDALNNNIVTRGSENIQSADGFIIHRVANDAESPIFMENNRHYVVKDYIFHYISRNDD